MREGDATLLKRCDHFFASVHIVDLSADLVYLATPSRARHVLKTRDAVHAASAFVRSAHTLLVMADVGPAQCDRAGRAAHPTKPNLTPPNA